MRNATQPAVRPGTESADHGVATLARASDDHFTLLQMLVIVRLSQGVDSSVRGHLALDGLNLVPVQEAHFSR